MRPEPPNLPWEKVTVGRPFEVTGAEYTSALIIADESDVPKKSFIYVHSPVPGQDIFI